MSPQDEPIVYRDLRRSINALRTKNYADKSFIPNDDFDAAFTKPVLEHYAGHLLGDVGAGRSHLAELYQNYRKTIAILVLMDYENSFVNFWALKDYSDESLPIGQERLAEIDPDLSPCPLWVQFNELQHLFLAPPFRLEPEPMDWSEQFVLPFLEKKYKGRGNFSTVYRIKIHPAYDQLGYDYCGEQEVPHRAPFQSEGKLIPKQPHSYALKQLKSTEETGKVRKDSIIEWQNEVRANVVVRKQEHQNIIPLLHSHIYGPHCNLIFPLATYNLKEFYLNQKHPQPGEPRLRFIEKITRLVPALGTIHHGGDDSDAPSHGTKVGYHRDIKPDNILVFGKSQRFMISDLGLMKFHEIKGDKPDYTGEVSSTGISAYAAPECGVQGKKVGRAADIWSMGCILAEAITWCVCGHLGKVEFDRKRMTRDEIDGYEENRFFKRTRSSSTTLLKLEVVAWFNEIRERSDGDPLISECLELVQSIFKDGSRSRPTAEKIDCTFYEILNKHAKRLGVALLIEQPNYCNLVQPDTVRQTLPLSYSRSASRITLKRRRTENEFSPPSLYKGYSSLSPLPPLKKMRDISPYVHLKRLDTVCSPVVLPGRSMLNMALDVSHRRLRQRL